MRVMRVIYQHTGDACDNALSLVLRGPGLKTPGISPPSKTLIPFVYGFRILETLDVG